MSISITADKLIYPYFVVAGTHQKQEVKLFPDAYRLSVDNLLVDIEEIQKLGIRRILLFGVPHEKDAEGREAYASHNMVGSIVKMIKKRFHHLTVMTDICLCAYTTHGHCGVLNNEGNQIHRGRTIKALAKMALMHAEAGVDYVAPSAMAKQQVLAIRRALDRNGYRQTKIMGYSAKFASSFYGPFREVADSAPRFGDRRAYQLSFKNTVAALKEIEDDIKEGADIVMVKPALGYLDVIKEAKQQFRIPLAAYNVSGEYAMVKYGARMGLWDERSMVFEVMTAMRRAGADLVITYHAKDIARWLKK